MICLSPPKEFNMDLTPSGYNILLNMTKLSQSPSLISRAKSQPVTKVSAPSVRRKTAAEPSIYHHDGSLTQQVSRREVVELISADPSGKHLLWAGGNKRWRSWRELPSLVSAVESVLREERASHPKTTKTDVQNHPQVGLNRERGSLPLTLNSEEDQSLIKRDLSGGYYSVPETVFTHFEVDLTDTDHTKVFVGLDHSLDRGGIFIATERVLNVGDYIQVRVLVKGKTLLSFEAPISWLRWPDAESPLPEGVAVQWPTLTPMQKRVISRSTNAAEYEFFVA